MSSSDSIQNQTVVSANVLPVTADGCIASIQKEHFYRAACALLKIYNDLDFEPPSDRRFTGGIMAIMTFNPRKPELTRTAMLTIHKPGVNNPICAYEVMEKIKRLCRRRHYSGRLHEHFASQSADNVTNKKGGCVLGIDPDDNISEVYISFSGTGLSDTVAEALCYGVAKKFELKVSAHYDNPLVKKTDFDELMRETVWI